MVYAPSYANPLYLMNLATIKSLTSIRSGPIGRMHYQPMLTPLFLSGNRKKFLSPPWIDGEALHAIRKKELLKEESSPQQ